MSKLPRFVNASVPDSDGVMHTVDWMRADIAGELLEALESMTLAADSLEVHAPCVDGLSGLESASDKARAAIAKARGGV